MATSGPGFDMSKVTTASKILLGGSALLLLDSFLLAWQEVCADLGNIPEIAGIDNCARAGMWSGNGAWAGTLTGLLACALIVWEGLLASGQRFDAGQPSARIGAYLGFGILGFGVLKFLFVIANDAAIGAWIGLVLIVVIGYGSWMRFQETESAGTGTGSAPPASPSPGDPIA